MGFVLWSVFPELRTIIACLLTATLIFYVFFAAVRLAVGQLGDQLIELHREIDAIAERLEHMDRKTNALLRNALAHRQAANLGDKIRAAPKQALAKQRRSA
jgi:hypothetical protein